MASKKAKSFSINEAISFGFKHATSKVKFFSVLILIIIVVMAVPSILSAIAFSNDQPGLGFVLRIIHWGVQILIALGVISISLRVYDKKKVEYTHLFKNSHLIISYFIASMLYGLAVIVGLIVFIVPGIYLGIKYQYYGYFIVDQRMSPIDALKKSAKITDGIKWNLFFLKLALVLVNLLGAVCFVVGLLITIPTTMIAEAYVYRKLTGK